MQTHTIGQRGGYSKAFLLSLLLSLLGHENPIFCKHAHKLLLTENHQLDAGRLSRHDRPL